MINIFISDLPKYLNTLEHPPNIMIRRYRMHFMGLDGLLLLSKEEMGLFKCLVM